MQAVTPSHQLTQAQPGSAIRVAYEWLLVAALLALSVWLRLAELDTVPLSEPEATQALAAWRALHPHLSGGAIVPESPLLFLLHGVAFSALGSSEFTVRVFTALAGALLLTTPLLFRDALGRGRAFLFTLLLTFSPVLLVASRFDSPMIWCALCAVLGLWALWRWWRSGLAGWALAASALFAAVVLLTDPAGWIFGLVLLGAGAVALLWNRVDNPDDDPLPQVQQHLRGWPWQQALLVGGLALFAVATAFMFYLPGLSAISQLLQSGFAGLLTSQAGAPPAFPLLTTLFYEPLLWVFGLAGFLLLARRGELTLLDRFLAAWVVLGGLAALLYQGGGPQHALWLTLPLTGLATAVALECLKPDKHPFLDVPPWGKWVVAVVVFALLIILAINFQGMVRAVLQTADGSLLSVQPDPINTVWTVIALLFMIVGYFLVSSLWGSPAALRGGALGVLAFALVTSLGSGWAAAVTNAANPAEFWHVEPTSRETLLLRDTLRELTRRESEGFPRMTVYVQAPDDGVIGWMLREFTDARYIVEPTEARAQEVALLAAAGEPPELGGSYVGQNFVLARTWAAGSLAGLDFLPWWTQRRVRLQPLPTQEMTLWLRQDVYDGVDFSPAG